MSVDIAPIEWPADLLDDEEQDEPLAGQDHSLTIQNLVYPLYALAWSALLRSKRAKSPPESPELT
jgi:hypothetical protein